MAIEGSYFIDVVAAVFRQGDLVLVARRAQGQHLEYKWEFPGGKIEENETSEECLCRELKEELGVVVEVGKYVGESIFSYPDKNIRLIAYQVKLLSGNFTLNVHDRIDWVEIKELSAVDLASADIPISLILQNQ
jgi:8-oxo-dGTP diphosphatase